MRLLTKLVKVTPEKILTAEERIVLNQRYTVNLILGNGLNFYMEKDCHCSEAPKLISVERLSNGLKVSFDAKGAALTENNQLICLAKIATDSVC